MRFVLSIRSLINIRGGQAAAARVGENVGWRVDYQVITPNLKERIKAWILIKTTFFRPRAFYCFFDYDL